MARPNHQITTKINEKEKGRAGPKQGLRAGRAGPASSAWLAGTHGAGRAARRAAPASGGPRGDTGGCAGCSALRRSPWWWRQHAAGGQDMAGDEVARHTARRRGAGMDKRSPEGGKGERRAHRDAAMLELDLARSDAARERRIVRGDGQGGRRRGEATRRRYGERQRLVLGRGASPEWVAPL